MGKKYNLYLKGFVGGSDFDSSYVDYILSKHPGEEVTVLIDSLGGSLASALTIASAFSRHGNVTVHFAGMNASAATIAALGAKRVTMEASAMYLVHKCSSSVFEWGSLNADELTSLIADLEAQKRDLEKMDVNVAQMYARRTCKPKCQLLDLMKVGGWMSATEAKEWGFVDEITDDAQPAPVMTDEIATALASEGIPVPDIPVSRRESALARFFAAFSAFLSGNREKEDCAHIHEEQNNPDSDIMTDTPMPGNNYSIPETNNPNPTYMNNSYVSVMALLAVEALAADADGSVTLTAEQMKTVDDRLHELQEALSVQSSDVENSLKALSEKEAALKEKADALAASEAELAAVKGELDALRKAPGDSTSTVIDSGKGQDAEALSFIDTFNSANDLYNQLPS